MPRLKYSLFAAAGIVLLAVVLSVIGPKRALAAIGYTPIRDADNPGLHPFQTVLGNGQTFTVPARQRLIIDTVDGQAIITTGVFLGFDLTTQTNGFQVNGTLYPVTHVFPATYMGSLGGRSYYVMTQHVQLYADPGTTVDWQTGTNGSNSSFINISGHLVDIP